MTSPALTANHSILGVPIVVARMQELLDQVDHWAAASTHPRLVTFTNVHMVIESHLRPPFCAKLQQMDLNCPDGFPIYWLTRRHFPGRVDKIAGPEFMPAFCARSVAPGYRHFIYGGAPGVAQDAAATLSRLYPGIAIAGHYAPPFRKLSEPEMDEVAAIINASSADIVWVCLGCPRQEEWIYAMQPRLEAKVLLAVGQAVDILAGRTQRAPALVIGCGGEWLYRLIREPRRLWKRYLVTNLLFVLLLARHKLEQIAGSAAPPLERTSPRSVRETGPTARKG